MNEFIKQALKEAVSKHDFSSEVPLHEIKNRIEKEKSRRRRRNRLSAVIVSGLSAAMIFMIVMSGGSPPLPADQEDSSPPIQPSEQNITENPDADPYENKEIQLDMEWQKVEIGEEVKDLQNQADQGHRVGLLDPVQVAAEFMNRELGISGTLMDVKKYQSSNGNIIDFYFYDGRRLEFLVIQPVKVTDVGIWAVQGYRLWSKEQFQIFRDQYIQREEALDLAREYREDATYKMAEFVTGHDKFGIKRNGYWFVKGTLPSGEELAVFLDGKTGDVITSDLSGTPYPKDLYKDNIYHIKAIVIEKNAASRTYTDSYVLENIKQALRNAEFAGRRSEMNVVGDVITVKLQFEERAAEDKRFLVLLQNGEINVYDFETRSYWRVPGMNGIVEQLIPEEYLSYREIIEMVQTQYPYLTFPFDEKNPLLVQNKGFQEVKGNEVFQVVGFTENAERLNIFLHPVTGEILDQEILTFDGLEDSIKNIFSYISNQNFDQVWEMIHPILKEEPIGGEAIRQVMEDYYKGRSDSIQTVKDIHWDSPFIKDGDCNCIYDPVVQATIVFNNGSEEVIHAVRNERGDWKFIVTHEGSLK